MYKVITNQDNDIYVTPENEMLSFDAVTNKELENAVSDLESVIDTKYDKISAEQEHYELSEKIDAEESRAVAKETDLSSAIQNVETAVSQTLDSAKDYTDTKLANLVNSAPETLDTLGELATALQENANVVEVLNSSISNKANKSELDTTNANVTELSERVTALENKGGVTAVNITVSKTGDIAANSNTELESANYTNVTPYEEGGVITVLNNIFGDGYKMRSAKVELKTTFGPIETATIKRVKQGYMIIGSCWAILFKNSYGTITANYYNNTTQTTFNPGSIKIHEVYD